MPNLGFLKKIRTKDSSGNRDITSPTSAQSPGFPSSASAFKASDPSASSQTLYSQNSNTSNKSKESTLVNQVSLSQGLTHQPAPASAPQDASLDQTPSQSHQPDATGTNLADEPQVDGTAQSQMDGHSNGSRGAQAVGSMPAVRTTKGKYNLTDFTIQRTLGTGSFGRVHLVQSKHNQRFYAVKVLKKQQVVKMKQVEHTNDERKMLQKVKHPFLITLWGTFQDSKNLYMVMDFVEGGELFSLLRKSQVSDIDFFMHYSRYYSIWEYMDSLEEKRFPNPVAKFYAAEVTLALDYLHSMHIIYRDLKPENLLLDRHGHLKITDFGFAKEVPDITWTLCGTPDYLAPEVVASKGYNKSVDW